MNFFPGVYNASFSRYSYIVNKFNALHHVLIQLYSRLTFASSVCHAALENNSEMHTKHFIRTSLKTPKKSSNFKVLYFVMVVHFVGHSKSGA